MSTSTPVPAAAASVPRVPSLDAFRGFVMFLMLAEAMRLWTLHAAFPDEPLLGARRLQHHARAVAGVLAPRPDPARVLVPGRRGAAVLDRQPPRAGAELRRMLGARGAGAAWSLILLGIFLRSMERPQTYWTFEDTLTQIGLGYTFLFLLAFASLRVQVVAFVAILAGLLGGVRALPAAAPRASTTRASACRPDWPHLYSGFLAHFNKNSNLSWAFDTWFLNLFPRQSRSCSTAAAGRP